MDSNTQVLPTQTAQYRDLMADILSQSITGELIGMANFAALVELIDDPIEMMEAVEHANSERSHAVAFRHLAEKHNLQVIINPKANYWRRVREAFMKWAERKDFIACLLIQEVMLEAFAVGMYREVGRAFPGEFGRVFTAIAAEEEEHMEHSIELLRQEMQKNPEAFIEKVAAIHEDCMTILAEWSAKTDSKGHCEVCKGNCMKESLYLADLNIGTMRGQSMALYLEALDSIGIPGEKSIVWVANLPA